MLVAVARVLRQYQVMRASARRNRRLPPLQWHPLGVLASQLRPCPLPWALRGRFGRRHRIDLDPVRASLLRGKSQAARVMVLKACLGASLHQLLLAKMTSQGRQTQLLTWRRPSLASLSCCLTWTERSTWRGDLMWRQACWAFTMAMRTTQPGASSNKYAPH